MLYTGNEKKMTQAAAPEGEDYVSFTYRRHRNSSLNKKLSSTTAQDRVSSMASPFKSSIDPRKTVSLSQNGPSSTASQTGLSSTTSLRSLTPSTRLPSASSPTQALVSLDVNTFKDVYARNKIYQHEACFAAATSQDHQSSKTIALGKAATRCVLFVLRRHMSS